MNRRPAVVYEGRFNEKQVDVLGFGVYNGVTRAIVESKDGKTWMAELHDVRFLDNRDGKWIGDKS